MKQVTGIVLAGGKSSRMGQNKALMPYAGVTLIEHITGRLKPYCQSVMVSVREKAPFEYLGLPLLEDHKNDCGPLAGIEAALSASSTDLCFIVPCDLPLFSGAIVPLLMAEIGDADACVPVLNNYYEPLVALYAKSVLPEIDRALAEKRYKVKDIFANITVKQITEDYFITRKLEHIFENLNTFTEYNKILQVQQL